MNASCITILNTDRLGSYVEAFDRDDSSDDGNAIPRGMAESWMAAQVPRFECPDPDVERTYYFRWWTYRKHLRKTPDGFVVTEFLPQVEWSKRHNTINGAAGHHLYEGRWIHDARYMDEYLLFWFRNGGDPGGVTKVYSEWLADAAYARFLVNGDRAFAVSLLGELVRNHEAWSRDGEPGNSWQASRRLPSGLYWQIDSWEATEYSIGGTGARPPINSYQFGNAMAIARLAALAGERALAERMRAEAEDLRTRVEESLWDPADCFFKVRRDAAVRTDQYANDAAEPAESGRLVSVREIFGFVPWCFNLPSPDRGYEAAWRALTDPLGFQAPYGPTVADRRHPRFKINETGCRWCGASWPFATSQALTALANVLNNYEQDVIDRKAYFDTLLAYTRSHLRTLEDGRVVSWIDESLNPDTGAWILNGPRGKDYNHSTYNDLIITGLVGLRPQEDDSVVVNPLLPAQTWDYFCLDHVLYHGRRLAIVWDRTGRRYGRGRGLRVFADSREIASSDDLSRVEGRLPPSGAGDGDGKQGSV